MSLPDLDSREQNRITNELILLWAGRFSQILS